MSKKSARVASLMSRFSGASRAFCSASVVMEKYFSSFSFVTLDKSTTINLFCRRSLKAYCKRKVIIDEFPDLGMPEVKLYVRGGEPYCDMVRNLLQFHKVDFDMIEVSVSQERQDELLEISGQSNVPVLVVDNRVYVGFDFELLKSVLGLKGQE